MLKTSSDPRLVSVLAPYPPALSTNTSPYLELERPYQIG